MSGNKKQTLFTGIGVGLSVGIVLNVLYYLHLNRKVKVS
jgi:hypothetical protein